MSDFAKDSYSFDKRVLIFDFSSLKSFAENLTANSLSIFDGTGLFIF